MTESVEWLRIWELVVKHPPLPQPHPTPTPHPTPLAKMAAISQTIFGMHFREWKGFYFDWNVTEICP